MLPIVLLNKQFPLQKSIYIYYLCIYYSIESFSKTQCIIAFVFMFLYCFFPLSSRFSPCYFVCRLYYSNPCFICMRFFHPRSVIVPSSRCDTLYSYHVYVFDLWMNQHHAAMSPCYWYSYISMVMGLSMRRQRNIHAQTHTHTHTKQTYIKSYSHRQLQRKYRNLYRIGNDSLRMQWKTIINQHRNQVRKCHVIIFYALV